MSLLGVSAKMRGSTYDRKVFATKAESRNAMTAKEIFKVLKAMGFNKTGIFFER